MHCFTLFILAVMIVRWFLLTNFLNFMGVCVSHTNCEHNDCHPVQVYHALPKCFMEIVIGKQTLTPDNFYVLPY